MSALRQNVQLERQEPTYYARIPKMVIMDMDLDPYELALYCNYKQTAAESGVSFKSNKTLAKECKMSPRKVQDARRSLEAKNLIKLEYIKDENGVINQSVRVTIIDVWEQNHNLYASSDKIIPMHDVRTPHVHDAYPHAHDAPKEEPINKNQDKNDETRARESLNDIDQIENQLSELGVFDGARYTDRLAFHADFEDYTVEDWQAGIEAFKREISRKITEQGDKYTPLPYNYLEKCVSGEGIKRKQASLVSNPIEQAAAYTDAQHNKAMQSMLAEQKRLEELQALRAQEQANDEKVAS